MVIEILETEEHLFHNDYLLQMDTTFNNVGVYEESFNMGDFQINLIIRTNQGRLDFQSWYDHDNVMKVKFDFPPMNSFVKYKTFIKFRSALKEEHILEILSRANKILYSTNRFIPNEEERIFF